MLFRFCEWFMPLENEHNINELDTGTKIIISLCWLFGFVVWIGTDIFVEFERNQITAILGAYMAAIHWGEWLYYFITSGSLHQIRILCKKYSGHISIPYKVVSRPHTVVPTVSGLSAVRGSTQNRILMEICVCSSYCLLFSLSSHVRLSAWEQHHLLALLSSLGMYFVGVWDFNRSCWIHMAIHNISCVLASLIIFAFLRQQKYSLFSAGLLYWCVSVFCVLCMFWNVIPYETNPDNVHTLSTLSIILEIFVLAPVFISSYCYIYGLN